jgi:acyl-CoA thioester hydrolase
MVDQGFDVVVADVHAAFRAPVRFDDEVDLALTIQRFGRTSMTTSWVSSVGGSPCVEGEIVHVFVDPTSLQPVPVPDRARDRLARHVVG